MNDGAWIAKHRAEFEEAAYKDYFARSIKFNESEQFASCDVLPKDEFFEMNDDGYYADVDLDVMWHGWKLAKGIA